MISKLPKWVGIGAWALAFVGGMVNVVGFLSFEHQAVTHLTGTVSMLGAAIAGERGRDAVELVLVIASFLAGSTVSGFIIQESALKLGRRYGVVLILESVLLCIAAALLKAHHTSGMYLAAGACGLQNAMATTYSGSVIRTTHLSGMFTDLGISLGHLLRGLPVESRRIRIAWLIITAFLSGGVAGAFFFHHLDYNTLFIPATLTGLVGLTYMVYQHSRR